MWDIHPGKGLLGQKLGHPGLTCASQLLSQVAAPSDTLTRGENSTIPLPVPTPGGTQLLLLPVYYTESNLSLSAEFAYI